MDYVKKEIKFLLTFFLFVIQYKYETEPNPLRYYLRGFLRLNNRRFICGYFYAYMRERRKMPWGEKKQKEPTENGKACQVRPTTSIGMDGGM